MAKVIPVVIGLLGCAGAVSALAQFQRFESLLGSFLNFANLRPGRNIAPKPFAIAFIMFGFAWGVLMVLLGLHQ